MNADCTRSHAEVQDPKGHAHLQGVRTPVPVGEAVTLVLFDDVPESPSPEHCACLDTMLAIARSFYGPEPAWPKAPLPREPLMFEGIPLMWSPMLDPLER